MKTQISASLKLFAVVLFSFAGVNSDSFLFTQAKAQSACAANWDTTISKCTACFTNMSMTTSGGITSDNWNFGDGSTSTLPNPCHTYSVSGTYNVCLAITVSGFGLTCYDTLCKSITVQCGTTGIASSSQIDLSLSVTNPVFSSADINYSIPSSGSVKLSLFDIVGNNIGVLENGSKSAGIYSCSMNTGSFSKGIYFAHLNFEGVIITKKIILLNN